MTTIHLPSIIATRTSLLAHLRNLQPTPPGGRSMLKNLTKHVGTLIKHIRVSFVVFVVAVPRSDIVSRFLLLQRLEDANPKGFASIPGANEVVISLWGNVKGVLLNEYDSSGLSCPNRRLFASVLIPLSFL